LLGIREVLSHANEVQIEQNIVNIPSFPGMIILKLIAWSDRPEDRDSDLKDILLIIQKSYDLNWDEIVESHYDLLDTENFDELMISAQLLGRKAANIIGGFEELQERIYTVLEENLKEVEKSVIGIEWARRLNKDVHYAQKILNYFLKGLKDIRE
jgi:predicted nucleotidyltransferase